MTDIRQTLEYANYLKSNGWTVERIDEINYFIKKLPLLGSILKLQRPKEIDFKITEKLSKKYGVFQTIIESGLALGISSKKGNPTSFRTSKDDPARAWSFTKNNPTPTGTLALHNHKLMLSNGFKLSRNPYLPTKTLQIDLAQKKEQIYSKFSKDCKYSIRKGSGLIIKEYSTPEEINKFRIAWKKSINFKRFVPSVNN